MRLDKAGVLSAMIALGDHLEQMTDDRIELVVCGGSALQALGLVDRATRDVDVLALVDSSNDLLCAEPLPQAVIEAASTVARDFGLPADWLNPGPTDLLYHGLPEGLTKRLHSRKFGQKLVVHFIDRFDHICLKTYAAINGGSAHHLTDLLGLAPSDEEMLVAARWSLTQDASEAFPSLVRSFLEKVGYPNVADRIKADS